MAETKKTKSPRSTNDFQSFPQLAMDRFGKALKTAVDIGLVAVVSVNSDFASLSTESEPLKSIQVVPFDFIARIVGEATIYFFNGRSIDS